MREDFFEGLCNFLIEFLEEGVIVWGIGEDEEGEDMGGGDSESDDDEGMGFELEEVIP